MDLRADIYSMGVVVYQMLVGEVPYHTLPEISGKTTRQDAGAAPATSPPVLPNTPESVRAVVSRALTERPEERYAQAGELALAFRKAVQDSTCA